MAPVYHRFKLKLENVKVFAGSELMFDYQYCKVGNMKVSMETTKHLGFDALLNVLAVPRIYKREV